MDHCINDSPDSADKLTLTPLQNLIQLIILFVHKNYLYIT